MNAQYAGSKKNLSHLLAIVLVLTVALVTMASPAMAAPKTVVGQWNDAKGRTVILREGSWNAEKNQGFGQAKISGKHAIYKASSTKYVTQNPNGGVASGNQQQYDAYANKKVCQSNGTCTYTESRRVISIVDFRYFSTYYGSDVSGVLGVATTYCVNPNSAVKCPSWVEVALNNPVSASTSASAPESGASSSTTSELSYSPLGPVK